MKVFGAISKTPVRAVVTVSDIDNADNNTLEAFATERSGVSESAILSVNIKRYPDDNAAEVTLWTD